MGSQPMSRSLNVRLSPVSDGPKITPDRRIRLAGRISTRDLSLPCSSIRLLDLVFDETCLVSPGPQAGSRVRVRCPISRADPYWSEEMANS